METTVSGRMNVFYGGVCPVIVDYAHNELSARALYESLKEDYPGKNIKVVFGCPGDKGINRRKDMGLLAGEFADYIYLTAEDPGHSTVKDICSDIIKYIEKYHNNYEVIEDRKEAILKAIHDATKDDVIAARNIIEEAGGDACIISKIESRMRIENLDDIIDVSDGIMVARGDLGVEVPMEELPILQKEIIRKCRERGKFAIVATEMLASMYENPRPSRAEVSDVANAVLDGTDCVMLSGETTVGKYPVQSVEIMSKTCKYVESTIDYTEHFVYKGSIGINDTIAKLVVGADEYSDIKLIVTPTMTGFTATKISNLRPNSIILACCPSNHIAEKIVLNFGVKPVITKIYDSTDEMVENARKIAKKEFNLNDGDLIVVTGGFPLGKARTTNYLRIVEI